MPHPPWGTVAHYALEATGMYDTGVGWLEVHPPELAAGVAQLNTEARRDHALRLRLPPETSYALDSVDPGEIARGLGALRDALETDVELYAMIPQKLREGLQMSYGYTSTRPECFTGGCRDVGHSCGGYDYESFVRASGVGVPAHDALAEFCDPASEELAAQFQWVVA